MVWTSHLKEEKDRKDFEGYLRNSTTIFDRLRDILHEKKPKPSKQDYEKASWAYYQAHQNGKEEAIKEILDLINFYVDK